MTSPSLLSLLKGEEYFSPIDLFSLAGSGNNSNSNLHSSSDCCVLPKQTRATNGSYDTKVPQSSSISVVVDSESCLDRLYGGYYSDWASGGQWNRMLGYINNLAKACDTSNFQLVVAMRGGVEREHAQQIFNSNKDFKDRLSRVMLHLQNRGTPPPKVWWLPPTCLREVICLAMQFYGISVFSTLGDYYGEVKAFIEKSGAKGILTDDSSFALLGIPRVFAAHDFKLTYKGTLESKEYQIEKWTKHHQLSAEHIYLLASLLGNHILPVEYLKEFHEDIAEGGVSNKSSEECEKSIIVGLVNFIKKFPDLRNQEAFGHVVFRNSTFNMEDCLSKLNESVLYYKKVMSAKINSRTPVKTEIEVNLVEESGSNKKTSDKSCHKHSGTPPSQGMDESLKENGFESDKKHSKAVNDMLSNGDMKKNGTNSITLNIESSDAILKLCLDRHKKGLMSPYIVQALVEKEVRLPCYIEHLSSNDEQKSVVEIYRPIRQSIYAILHNLNKHLYDSKKLAEENNLTVSADDIKIEVVEHYLSPLAIEQQVSVSVTPVSWPVPSLESLWLGVKPENKVRRMKAFLSCMQAGSDPLITNISHVPERFLLLCSVLRFLLKCEPAIITLQEVDAVLAMATSQILFDVQTMQDMQLPLITPRGAHIASVIMAGIQHAMLVNDVCGAPVRREITPPWLYFDGKLFQYKLLKATSAHHVQRLDLCDGQMAQLLQMERLRQVVLHGLHEKFGEQQQLYYNSIPLALPAGRMFATPTAYLRPNIPSAGRGKGSLMGDFLPPNTTQQLDNRGGKLQIAGQVVATWGPRPGQPSATHLPAAAANYTPLPSNQQTDAVNNYKAAPTSKKPAVKSKRNGESRNRNQNSNHHSHQQKTTKAADRSAAADKSKHVTIAVKPEQTDQVDVQVLPDEELDDVTQTTGDNDKSQDVSNDSGINADAALMATNASSP